MNQYVADLQTRAPGLFLDGHTTYTGEYIEAQKYRDFTGTIIRQGSPRIAYKITNTGPGRSTSAKIVLPLHDAADFETALRNRIQEMNA